MNKKHNENVSKAESIVAGVLKDWNKAMSSWDIEKLLDVYDEEVLFFGAQPSLSIGHKGVKSYFDAIPAKSNALEFSNPVVLMLDERHIAVSAYAGFVVTMKSGDKVCNDLRITWSLIKRDNGWKIVSHHVSPVGL